MKSCFVDAVGKRERLSNARTTLSIVPNDSNVRYSVTSSPVPRDARDSPPVDRNSFFKLLCLAPTQSSGLHKPSEVVECNVIVIDDDDDEDEQISHYQKSYLTDLFGTTRPLRGDLVVNGNASTRLLQPCSRLRKLLNIDITSPLGSRTLQCVISALKKDGVPLNPCTVSHCLGDSDNTLDYGRFCRTPVKGKFGGRLRQREFPVKYRLPPASKHYHKYCFNRADRRRFCRRFDCGLSDRSYQLRQKYGRCSVVLDRLTAEETGDWRSSQRLRDYVTRMEEKEKAAAMLRSSQHTADVEVIDLSSDSEEEVSLLPVAKQEFMFRCHQCAIKLPCGSNYRRLIREHYRTFHGIVNIDIVCIVQPDGSTTIQIIHVTTSVADSSVNSSSGSPVIDLCTSTPTPQRDSSLDFQCPIPSQSHVYPMPSQLQCVRDAWQWQSGDGEHMAINGFVNQTHANSQPPSHTFTQRRPALTNSEPATLLPDRNSDGDAESCSAASDCDPDVICLD